MAKRTNQPSVKQRREQMRQQTETRQRRTRIIGFGVLAVVLAIIGWFVFQALRPEPAATDTAGVSGERPLAALPPAERADYYAAYPETVIDTSKSYEALIEMAGGGQLRLALFDDAAPQTVNNFVFLANQGFYDGTTFHRVLDGFMAQGGDPTGTGMGGSDKPDIAAEFNDAKHVRGTCSMARTMDPNSANSQFFICFDDARFLDRQYTVWGEVESGMEHIDALPKGEPPREPGKIVKATVS